MKVFLSVGSTYTDKQEAFVTAFEAFLAKNECTRLTVGRGNFSADQPILQAKKLMRTADAVVVIAFARYIVEKGVDRPDSDKKKELANLRYPTVWNQLEAAMGYGLDLPLLVIVEKGIVQEAMLKDRMEYRAIVTDLDPRQFESEEFRGIFMDFRQKALERNKDGGRVRGDPASMTIGDLLRNLRPAQLWGLLLAIVTILTAVVTVTLWINNNLRVAGARTGSVSQPATQSPATHSTSD